jgi:hypothetical protein
MSSSPYQPDPRKAADLLAEVRQIAEKTVFPGNPDLTWADVLFQKGENVQWGDSEEPSSALLQIVIHRLAELVQHYNTIPDQARHWYFLEKLKLPPLLPVADQVIVQVEGDPKRLPRLLPQGSRISAGMGERGERLYATRDALEVSGCRLIGLHSHAISESNDYMVRRDLQTGEMDTPISPFGMLAEFGRTAGPHEFYIASDLLRSAHGDLSAYVTLEFDRGNDQDSVASFLESLTWEYTADTESGWHSAEFQSRDQRWKGHAFGPSSRSRHVSFELKLVKRPAPRVLGGVETHALRATLPESASRETLAPLAMEFQRLIFSVRANSVFPEAGFHNQGLLDLTQPFEPFGPQPRDRDCFVMKADDVFGKPLRELEVHWTLERVGTMDVFGKPLGQLEGLSIAERVRANTNPFGQRSIPPKPIHWRVFRKGRWERGELPAYEGLAGMKHVSSSTNLQPFSERTQVSGQEGHFLQVVLHGADYGFQQFQGYLLQLADFHASRQANPDDLKAAPTARSISEPPLVAEVKLSYLTKTMESNRPSSHLRLMRRFGLADVAEFATQQPFRLFPMGMSEEGPGGLFYVGLDRVLPGRVMTMFLEMEEASVCGESREEAKLTWRYHAESGWKAIEVVDGTLGFRHTGIVRFVAPIDWKPGATAIAEPVGFWLRIHTTQPRQSGTIRSAGCDAVLASYQFVAPPETDNTPAMPLPVGAIKTLKPSLPGIKKVRNVAPSFAGRGTEPQSEHFQRTSQVARHGMQAVNAWDIERMVQAEFPDVKRVRCLPHHSANSECAAGWISLIIVPRSSSLLPQPSSRLMAQIKHFVARHATPRMRIQMLCPVYTRVEIQATLHLKPGVDAGPAADRLQEDITSLLHPLRGSLNHGSDRPFGQGLFLSEITRFLEDHPLVELAENVGFVAPHQGRTRIEVSEPCRGLITSGEKHALTILQVIGGDD